MDNEERHAGVTEKHTTTDDPSGWQPAVLVFVLSWAAWLLLAGTLSVDEILVGAVAALMVTLISGAHLAVFNGVRFTPMAFAHLAAGAFAIAANPAGDGAGGDPAGVRAGQAVADECHYPDAWHAVGGCP
jgi:hypothetical protein